MHFSVVFLTISNIYLFDRQGTVISSFNDKDLNKFQTPNPSIYQILDKNRAYIFRIDDESISAYRKINFFKDIFIQVNRNLNKNIWKHIIETRNAYEIYSLQEEICASIISLIFFVISKSPTRY